MQNVERLSITLPREMAQCIRGAVSSGGYASNSEVIREAVRMWQEADAARQQRLADVRAAVAEAGADPRPSLSFGINRHFQARKSGP